MDSAIPSRFNVRLFALWALAAAVINSILFQVYKSGDSALVVNLGGTKMTVGAPAVLVVSFFALTIAYLVISKIGASGSKLISNISWIGLVFAILTALAPLIGGKTLLTSLGLSSLHLVAGIFWFLGVRRTIHLS